MTVKISTFVLSEIVLLIPEEAMESFVKELPEPDAEALDDYILGVVCDTIGLERKDKPNQEETY
jgi:hypothetical protein